MQDNEKKIAAERQARKTSVTSSLIEAGKIEAEKNEQLVADAEKFLRTNDQGMFPLLSALYWKLEAGMDVKPEIESHLWYTWANKTLQGFGKHVPRELRQKVARNLCEAAITDLQGPDFKAEFAKVLLQDLSEGEAYETQVEKKIKDNELMWSYTKQDLVLSLIGNAPFTAEMVDKINDIKLKVTEKVDSPDEENKKGSAAAKVQQYQISAPLSEQQEEAGLKREVILVVQIAAQAKKKFLTAIKKAVKPLKMEELECFRSPETQGKVLVIASAETEDMLVSYLTCALWSSNDESNEAGGDPFDANYTIEDIAEESIDSCEHDCEVFLKKAQAQGLLKEDVDMEQVGHDFWLTRNGHGAGFWDREEDVYGGKEVNDKLTKLAKEFGEINPLLGDDGQIHFEGGRTVTADTTQEIPDIPANPNPTPNQNDDEAVKLALETYFMKEASDEDKERVKEEVDETFDTVKGRYSDWGDSGQVVVDGTTWNWIATEEEARAIALKVVKQDLESEPEIFTSDWISQFLKISPLDRQMIAQEEAEAQSDGENLSEDEIEAKAKEIEEKLEDPIEYFVNEQGIYENAGELMKANFIQLDVDAAAESAIQTDGWPHFLSHYDGNYEEAGDVVLFRED